MDEFEDDDPLNITMTSPPTTSLPISTTASNFNRQIQNTQRKNLNFQTPNHQNQTNPPNTTLRSNSNPFATFADTPRIQTEVPLTQRSK